MTRHIELLHELIVDEDGTLIEEIIVVCTMTGYREKFIIHHLGDGYFQSVSVAA